MNGPVYRYDGRRRQLQALARVLGRPLVPAQQRRRRRSSTACCWTRPPTRTAACRSTPTASATRCRGRGSYMDSKFGPDGALYVQTYDGFFRAGPDVGIYRYDYVGGAADAGRGAAGVRRSAHCKVRFSSAGSGGVSYKWDFGDGADLDRGQPDAHLRRGQALHGQADGHLRRRRDGHQDGRRRRARARPTRPRRPRRPRSTRPRPGAGGTYTQPVTVTLTRDRRGRRLAASTRPSTASTAASGQTTSAPIAPSAARHVHDRVPLDGPHGQRRGDQVA